MDHRTEVVIFHDLAEVIVDNSKALVWVGTQTFTIRHLDEEEANEINSKNSAQTQDHLQVTDVYSVDEEPQTTTSECTALNRSRPDDEDDDCLLVPMRINGSAISNGDNYISSATENNNNDEIHILDDDDEVSASDTVHSLSSSSSNDAKEFSLRTAFNHKSIAKGPVPPNVCPICNKAFSCEYNRKRHQLSHFGIKPYKCSFCSKVFAQSSGYYAHKCTANTSGVSLPPPVPPLKKSQTKMLVCSACGKSFPGIYKLKRHEISHTGEKPYRCDICKRAFTQWTGMSRHNCPGKVVDGDKVPPSCEECGKIFKNSKYLDIHRQIHKFDGRSDVDDKDIDTAFISTDLEIDNTMDASDFIREMFC